MSKKKQTAVEWLFDQLPDHLRLSKHGMDMLNRAKEIEREQIQEAFYEGKENNPPRLDWQYYDQTYGKP